MGNISDLLCAPAQDSKKGPFHNWEQQMGFSKQHLSKGRCFTRCSFSPLGLSKSSVGPETCTAAHLLSHITKHRGVFERV